MPSLLISNLQATAVLPPHDEEEEEVRAPTKGPGILGLLFLLTRKIVCNKECACTHKHWNLMKSLMVCRVREPETVPKHAHQITQQKQKNKTKTTKQTQLKDLTGSWYLLPCNFPENGAVCEEAEN